jgi:uncharacterized protein YijF (DUF1287 family)
MTVLDTDSKEDMQNWFKGVKESFFKLQDEKYPNLWKDDLPDNNLEDRVVAALKKESE